MTELRAELNALKTAGESIDPVRLRYIESLLHKAERSRGPLAAVLETKVREAIKTYRQHGKGSRNETAQARGSSPRNKGIRDLTALLNTLQNEENDPDCAPLEQTLRQQELELVDAIAVQAEESTVARAARKEELKAARRFQSAMVRLNADKVLTQAIAEVPEECGPLNPQRLATRSLQTMKDLSPHYLNRFVSYIDTLFWLEQAQRGKK